MTREITISASTRPVCSSFFKSGNKIVNTNLWRSSHTHIQKLIIHCCKSASLNIAIKMNSPMSNTLNGFMNL